MRYITSKGLFFVHIPKCAGLSVSKALDDVARYPFTELATDLGIERAKVDRLLDGTGYSHSELGQIDPAHIPLRYLQSHFRLTWTLFSSATSFALIREPRARFISALMQRLLEFRKVEALRVEDGIMQEEAAHVCDWLERREAFCDLEYIHFTRQVDYTHLNGEPRVAHIFPLERTDAMVAWLAQGYGLAIDMTMHHARRQPRKWFKELQPAVRFIARNGLPGPVRRAIYPLWIKSGFFDTASAQYDKLALKPDIEAFIARYYAEDAALYQLAQDRVSAPPQTAATAG